MKERGQSKEKEKKFKRETKESVARWIIIKKRKITKSKERKKERKKKRKKERKKKGRKKERKKIVSLKKKKK